MKGVLTTIVVYLYRLNSRDKRMVVRLYFNKTLKWPMNLSVKRLLSILTIIFKIQHGS